MDLQLTRRGDYTVRAAISLAKSAETGEYRKLREIAGEMAIPERYTHEIVSLLVRAGIAEAMAGKLGGYRLTRAPSHVSLLDVVESSEGPLRLVRCTLSGGPCHWQDSICAVHPMWEEATKGLISFLKERSLADVIQVDKQLQTGRIRKATPAKGRMTAAPPRTPATSAPKA